MLKQTLLLIVIVMMTNSLILKAEESHEYFAPFIIVGGGVDIMLLDDETLFSIEPSVGFFVDDRSLVGFNFGFTRYNYNEDLEATLWTFGPHYRYYVYSFENNRIRFFMQGNMGLETGNTIVETPFGSFEQSIGPNFKFVIFEPGTSFQITDWLAVDLSFNVGAYYYLTDMGGEDMHNFGIGSNLNPMLDMGLMNIQRKLLKGKVYLYF